LLQPNLNEVLRYLGAGEHAPDDLKYQVEEVSQQLSQKIQPRSVWRVFPILRQGTGFFLSQTRITLTGKTASLMLKDYQQAAMLCCTLGSEFDTMLRAAQARDMAHAAILDACGSALVEAGCDKLMETIALRLKGCYLTDRFSPGYGDLPLTLQPAICSGLETRRQLGVYTNASLLLNPTKSVTAFVGISDKPQPARVRGCGYCNMADTCTMRKGGKNCGI
jgi:hypothetical protein